KEMTIARNDATRRRESQSQGTAITARKLADFRQSVEADELLMTQRLRDQEAQATRGARTTMAPAPLDRDKFKIDPDHPGQDNDMADDTDCAEVGEIYGEF